MKALIQVFIVLVFIAVEARANDGTLPPEELKGEWSELHELNFSKWEIQGFRGWAFVLDGGSKVFSFRSRQGRKFDLMVANPAYWTEQDKKEKRQVLFLIYQSHFYRIESGSDEEQKVIKMLMRAAERLSGKEKRDPALLAKLAELLDSRTAVFE